MNRKNINDIIRYLPLSSSIIGAPRKFAGTENYLRKHSSAGSILFHEEFDLTADLENFPSFFKTNKLTSKYSVFTAILYNARVWGRNGAVIGSGDYFISDVSREFNENLNVAHSIYYTLKQVKSKLLKGKVAVVGTAGANVYFHWMLDILPRFALLAKSISLESIDYFITEFSPLSYQSETLNRLGISTDKIIPSNQNWNFHIKADKLLVPSLPGPFLQPDKFQINFIKTLFKDEISTQTPYRKIYISRKKTGWREIVNEKEVLSFLSTLGFEIVYCEQMKVSEQVRLFSEASIVISSHGSALTNIAFCKAGTYIIDLFNQSHINACFWFIAKIVNLQYYYLPGKSCPQDNNPKNDNTLVDIEELKKLIDKFY